MSMPPADRLSKAGGTLAAAVLLGSILLAAAHPSAAATPATGAWIFPHDHQMDAVGDALDSSFYTEDNASEWIQDSYFADSGPDSAQVDVDLYNPTADTLYNVQLFVAVSDIDLLTAISFASPSAAVTVLAEEFSGGTPFLSDGSSFPSHGVFPASFTSFGLGDIDAGTGGITSVWVNVTGDFAGGLMVHLDYAAEDANGAILTGPFEADMNIFENGDEPPACTEVTFSIEGAVSDDTPAPGSDVTVTFTAVPSDRTVFIEERRARMFSELTTSDDEPVTPWIFNASALYGEGTGTWSHAQTVTLPDVLLPGDHISVTGVFQWASSCEPTDRRASGNVEFEVSGDASGQVHKASWWKNEFKDAAKGNKKLDFSTDTLTLFLQRVALHSEVFMYGPWNGVGPGGGCDDGWVDIGSFEDAEDVLAAHDSENKMSNKAERELLALWLNIASGAANLDSALKVASKAEDDNEDKDFKGNTPFATHSGSSTLSSDFDTVEEIVTFASQQLDDWSDGSGASRADLKLAKNLCKSVNQAWLVLA